MGGLRQKKYQSGESARYVTRKTALKMLQLTLKNFRTLCILKGIYPREPRHRKKAQHGATGIKTLYYKKDIQFLAHEPLIWKLRELKIYARKCRKARRLRDFSTLKRQMRKHPEFNLDHIVKERYPTFIDAIRDLDDCLTLCFLFSTFPSLRHVPRHQSELCRRLTVEFLHWVIAAKALRKVFVSIKGYYYQAEIKGQLVTWIVPHHFSFEPQAREEVDFKVMSTFVEFYTIVLGFVNFRLYHSLNLIYPPMFKGYAECERSLVDQNTYVSERIAALTVPLIHEQRAAQAEEVELDEFPDSTDDPEKLEKTKLELERVKNLKTLFEGLKFFVNREVPREPLVFIIRCFGGEVSWDKLHFVGATFDENDDTITHQIVDRPSIQKVAHPRFYIQPQWVFDSVNARQLLPMNKYFLGATLPPHLSPFVDDTKDHYVPPEERELHDPKAADAAEKSSEDDLSDDEDEVEDGVETKESSDEGVSEIEVNEQDLEEVTMKDDSHDELEKKRLDKKKLMSVSVGTITKEDPLEKARLARQEYRLREKMIPRKYHKLYRSMMKGRMERSKEQWLLRKKRRLHDEEKKVNAKAEKKQKLKAAVASV
ncbi:pescadillo homolog [Bacillus rossius redtenbacheri]|uniref:pescadillo homolog n=1 Tax=Bacillus rossius redtenbacheri TaxID=93214 RepID=UPI002FDDD397